VVEPPASDVIEGGVPDGFAPLNREEEVVGSCAVYADMLDLKRRTVVAAVAVLVALGSASHPVSHSRPPSISR
jgi:hypothetical protein